jgi:hypothetical protein
MPYVKPIIGDTIMVNEGEYALLIGTVVFDDVIPAGHICVKFDGLKRARYVPFRWTQKVDRSEAATTPKAPVEETEWDIVIVDEITDA